jgi:uncharacterized protein (TIGR02271 family)
MSKTVVGIFPSNAIAQSAKQQLVTEGYSPNNIQIVAQDSPVTTGTTTHESSDTGLGAKISNFFHSLTGGDTDETYYAQGVKQGGAILRITVADGEEEYVADLLEEYGAKSVNDTTTGTAAMATGVGAAAIAPHTVADTTSIPVVQEELTIGKRQVDRGGVRIFSHLVETPVEENIKLREERVRVDRQAVNRPATEADFTAFKEGAIELTETSEEAVVSKSARVVEEISIGKETSERTETIRDKVRHTEVEVTDLDAIPTRK